MPRADLNKLLCERERVRSWDSHHDYRKKVSGKPREGMAFRYGYNGKSFNENLSPLYRWVYKQVGRPWDKVYSELCKTFDKRSVINQHILGHLYQYVEMYAFERDGELYLNNIWRRSGTLLLKDSSVGLYIDPRDGILKDNKGAERSHARYVEKRKQEARDTLKTRRKLDAHTEARRQDENSPWFICALEPIPRYKVVTATDSKGNVTQHQVNGTAFDVWEKTWLAWGGSWRGAHHTTLYVASKRTASKKEIRDYGLAD